MDTKETETNPNEVEIEVEETDILDDDDEAVLDDVWAQIAKEEAAKENQS